MLAIYQYFSYNLPIKDRFKMIRAAGFDAVGLWRDDWFGITGHRGYADMARSAGLEITDGHAPFIRDFDFVNAIWLDNLSGEQTYETYRNTIIGCGEDGLKNLIIHITDDYHGRTVPPVSTVGIERFKCLTGIAENNDVTIALENISINSYQAYVFEHVNSPNLGFCYDSGHKNCFEPGADILSLFGEKIVAVHLHDNDGSEDQHRIPFEGSIDWRDQMSAIARTGYNGATTLECTAGPPGSIEPNDTRSAEEWLRTAFEAAKKLDALRWC